MTTVYVGVYLCVCVPDSVMLCTMGVIRASQQVRPRASAASASGRKRSANICSCLRALFSLNTERQRQTERERLFTLQGNLIK